MCHGLRRIELSCAGAAAELVSLQHWRDDTGQHRCKIEAFLSASTQPDMGVGKPNPIIQGVADLPGPRVTVDRAGDLVAAGMPVLDAVHDVWAFQMQAFSFL